MRVRFVDEFDGCLGWTPAQQELQRRTSHAVASGGRVWIVDPLDGEGLDARVRGLGEPAGVIQLLDRHTRDCRAVAARLGVELHVTPFRGVRDAPFDVVRVHDLPGWREAALWFPAERILVCGDALGSAPYFLAKEERIGVHPMLRLFPPKGLSRFEPRRLLVGHGEGIEGEEVPGLVQAAIRTSRRRIPSWLTHLAQSRRRQR